MNAKYLMCQDEVIDLGLLDHELASDIIILIGEIC